MKGNLAIFSLLLFVIFAIKKTVKKPMTEDERQLNNNRILNGLHPIGKDTFTDFIDTIERQTNYLVYLTSGTRSLSEQKRLNVLGTGAASGFSFHNYGLAIDLNLISKTDGTWVRKADSDIIWDNTGLPAIIFGQFPLLRWGGNFQKVDNVHFDLGNAYGIDQLFLAAKDNPETPLHLLDLSHA